MWSDGCVRSRAGVRCGELPVRHGMQAAQMSCCCGLKLGQTLLLVRQPRLAASTQHRPRLLKTDRVAICQTKSNQYRQR